MSNKVYDVLKWIALVVLPALASLYIGLGQFWNIPYPEQISGTIMLVDAFLGAILGISSIQYAKKGEK
nr:phage holin [bacterium]